MEKGIKERSLGWDRHVVSMYVTWGVKELIGKAS
jgi:hypothetical protein